MSGEKPVFYKEHGFFIACLPSAKSQRINQYILDTNIISKIYEWVEAPEYSAPSPELVGIFELIRKNRIFYSISVLEAAWPHVKKSTIQIEDFKKPNTARMRKLNTILKNFKDLNQSDFSRIIDGTLSRKTLYEDIRESKKTIFVKLD